MRSFGRLNGWSGSMSPLLLAFWISCFCAALADFESPGVAPMKPARSFRSTLRDTRSALMSGTLPWLSTAMLPPRSLEPTVPRKWSNTMLRCL